MVASYSFNSVIADSAKKKTPSNRAVFSGVLMVSLESIRPLIEFSESKYSNSFYTF